MILSAGDIAAIKEYLAEARMAMQRQGFIYDSKTDQIIRDMVNEQVKRQESGTRGRAMKEITK